MKLKQILLACTFLLLVGCTNSSAGYQKITPVAAQNQLIDSPETILLDVRTLEEYNELHIEGALLIPSTEIKDRIETQIPDKSTPIIVYCRSGNRSKKASEQLISMGYRHVFDLGGIQSYPYKENLVSN